MRTTPMRQHDLATIWAADLDVRTFDGARVLGPFAMA